jgi:hypothetical protein
LQQQPRQTAAVHRPEAGQQLAVVAEAVREALAPDAAPSSCRLPSPEPQRHMKADAHYTAPGYPDRAFPAAMAVCVKCREWQVLQATQKRALRSICGWNANVCSWLSSPVDS